MSSSEDCGSGHVAGMTESVMVHTLPGLERDDSPPMHGALHCLNAKFEKPLFTI
ncbi:hypothetical protein [Pseudomonas sp. 22 E 5]|nr:hypothetical protein [Pseudomonas sp. 22 E 5]